jgi:hypothetical protein
MVRGRKKVGVTLLERDVDTVGNAADALEHRMRRQALIDARP